MNSLYEALFNNNNPADILKKQKNIEGLNPKMIQDAARKYINFSQYIRAVLKPEKNADKTLKPF